MSALFIQIKNVSGSYRLCSSLGAGFLEFKQFTFFPSNIDLPSFYLLIPLLSLLYVSAVVRLLLRNRTDGM